jgi:hypothetical protein
MKLLSSCSCSAGNDSASCGARSSLMNRGVGLCENIAAAASEGRRGCCLPPSPFDAIFCARANEYPCAADMTCRWTGCMHARQPAARRSCAARRREAHVIQQLPVTQPQGPHIAAATSPPTTHGQHQVDDAPPPTGSSLTRLSLECLRIKESAGDKNYFLPFFLATSGHVNKRPRLRRLAALASQRKHPKLVYVTVVSSR